MRSVSGVIFASMCAVVSWVFPAQSGEYDDYKNVRTYRMAPAHECDVEDRGQFQVSCKYMQVGNISGHSLRGLRPNKDPRWKKLSKFEAGGERLKFAGLACARADTAAEANKIAMGRAYSTVSALITDFEEDVFTGQLEDLGYLKFDDGYKCTETALSNSGKDVSDLLEKMKKLYEMDDEFEVNRPTKKQQTTNGGKNVATFIITNSDRYTLSLSFVSKTRQNRAWPGGNRNYVLRGQQTYNLACQQNEKICFGAWRDYQTLYWGIGRGEHGCEGCCTTCGGTVTANLTDGGSDSFPQDNNGVAGSDVAKGIIEFGAAVLNSMNQGGSIGSTPTYRSNPSPGPRAGPHRQSGISK